MQQVLVFRTIFKNGKQVFNMEMLPTRTIVSFLTQVPFFSEVEKRSLEYLAKDTQQQIFKKDQVVFEKNDIGDALYVIYQGSVKIHGEEHQYDILNKGDCFGEYALIDNKERSASVTAIKETVVFKIGRHHFLNLLTNDSGFTQGILSVLIRRHRELDRIQENLSISKKELELVNSKMMSLVHGAMDSIIMFNSQLKIVLTNPSALSLFENKDVTNLDLRTFLDHEGTKMIKSIIEEDNPVKLNNYLPGLLKIVGSNKTTSINEGTISKNGRAEGVFYTLILRNIENRLEAENKINLLTNQTEYLEREIEELTNTYGIITKDIGMQNVLNLINQVAGTSATVLITGETGTGKELVARAIHQASERNHKPLIRLNCGAIPTNLIESELFGHKKGAFTGATEDRKGRFLLADKGTIFLDEIGELPLELQPKLLRVIQEGEFEPVGSSETKKIDVRIIAATHRDLLQYAKENKFREDLYYRLNVFPIMVPPLRTRGEDICLIAEAMIHDFSSKLNKQHIELSDTDRLLFESYTWPGNVRELQNLVERAVIVSQKGNVNWERILPTNLDIENLESDNITQRILSSKQMLLFEKENITRAVKQCGWKISGKNGAAELLDMKPTTLTSKIKALGIERSY
ncbi:sigma 54-interacting transcriptional regulator [Spongiivirga sp. MCCC 1A20706]|uniref:sigma 54-interacting transcriptional regulator n=1 Tax=Spongiivirga sp. MCCC 1A20706 TaxID=3160963 RepID=UPI003977D1AC